MTAQLSETIHSAKAGATVAGSSIASSAASIWLWVDSNTLKMTAMAGLLLTIVMIISHVCNTVRQNREHLSTMRERELRIELLKKELEGKLRD